MENVTMLDPDTLRGGYEGHFYWWAEISWWYGRRADGTKSYEQGRLLYDREPSMDLYLQTIIASFVTLPTPWGGKRGGKGEDRGVPNIRMTQLDSSPSPLLLIFCCSPARSIFARHPESRQINLSPAHRPIGQPVNDDTRRRGKHK